jgi:peptidoglycan/xylan/chitin deacetylase (PgdA/CDA1 family)
MYDEAGHMISNHTYSHLACSKTDHKKFIENIKKCHEMIRSYENFRPFFRFPYLDECKSFDIQNTLDNLGYKKGFVTIVTIDWYFNSLLQKALRNGKTIDYNKLRDLYLQMVLEAITKHDKSLISLIGYRPIHNILFHENDITALYLGDVIEMLRDNGWTIVDPEEAFANQNLSNKTQKISYNGNSIIPYYRKLFRAEVLK